MDKIKMKTPLVEMDGDEMTRVLWQRIKDILINPFVELKTEYYDSGGKRRKKIRRCGKVRHHNAERSARRGIRA